MRARPLLPWLLVVLALGVVGAQPCGTLGPAARSFAAGSLVIPMDNCYQRRDASAPDQAVACNASRDDGVFRAYGLVYFLMKHGVTVYWGIDAALPKASATAPDVLVPAPPAGTAVAQRMSWSDGSFADLATGASGITYLGGPFLVDAADAARVVAMLTDPADAAHADFARFRGEATIDVHRVQVGFQAAQVRPLTTTPPKLAILNVTPPAGKKTSSNVMYQYAVAAGLSWPCAGTGDCAGGLGAGCSKSGVLAYMANPGGDTAIPQVCSGGLCAPNFNDGPGLVYDILCDDDFVPPGAGKGYADTALAQGGYKLLWIPHWDTSGKTPTGATDPAAVPPLPAVTAGDKLAWQLRTIASFVAEGNNLFVECLGIQALEGVAGQDNVNGSPVGIPATRFQSPSGMLRWNRSGTPQPPLLPQHPNVQIGDFAYAMVSGAITTYYPDQDLAPDAAYRTGTERLLTQRPSTSIPGSWDVASTIRVLSGEVPKGSVAYLGGHDYSPKVSVAGSGQTAGTRIVLNTLLNLGFACSDPDTECNTGKLGVCSRGVLKCAAGGGMQCVAQQSASAETCNGLDDDCDGLVDEDGVCNPPSCVTGQTRACYDGPAGSAGKGACRAGVQTCSGGLWGACAGQVLPAPEVCNGKDDDCSGAVDDGNLCGGLYACVAGACVPADCSSESLTCPAGFTCTAGAGGARTCKPDTCSPACAAGQLCISGACVDPCAGVTCGPGAYCAGGVCVAGGCTLTGCPAGSICSSGACVADPCAGAACPTGTFCRMGDCVRSCAYVECAAGQACSADGFCEAGCSPACGSGQVCAGGACQPDPACAGVVCGAGQVCGAGRCVDEPCRNVRCPVGSCVAGQCVGGVAVRSLREDAPSGGAYLQAGAIDAPRSGGCGSAGRGDLAALAGLAALLLWRNRRSGRAPLPAPVPAVAPRLAAGSRARHARWSRATGAGAALVAALLVVTGCGSSKGGGGGGGDGGGSGGGGSACLAGQTACGTECVDLTSAALHCGACNHACGSGFACSGASCVFPTGNPYLKSIDPASAGRGTLASMRLTGDGFQSGAVARFRGAACTKPCGPAAAPPAEPGCCVEVPLAVGGASSATASGVDLSGIGTGAAEVRVLNPGRLVSNAAALSIGDALGLRGVTPAGMRQDQAGAVEVVLTGYGFLDGIGATLRAPSGALLALPTTYTGATGARASGLVPSTLAVGQYDLTVANPGSAASNALKISVTEGAPVLDAITPTCVVPSAVFAGSVTGSFLYPSSVVRVSGNSIVDSPLATSCVSGTDALGRCVGGLRVVADLSAIPPGSYDVTVVNPGLLRSSAQVIQLKASCP
jgi:hypothetical protein